MTANQMQDAIAEFGLAVRAEFVPFTRSRNSREEHKSLNWKVTLTQQPIDKATLEFSGPPRDILTTDYSAGSGHCPGNSTACPNAWDESPRNWQPRVTAWECEHGLRARWVHFSGFYGDKSKPILPDTADVIYSLVSDAGVLDCSTYEEWAGETGYDPDSRKGEAIYRLCLEIALKLRNGIGEAALQRLRDASQDY